MRKKQNIFKAHYRQTIPKRQSCSCEMECKGSDNENCKESCYCHPDSSETNTNMYTTNFGKKDIEKLRKYLSNWVKHKKKVGDKMTESKLDIVDRIIQRYQHYRKKEDELKILTKQQRDLKQQQRHLKSLLDASKKRITKKKHNVTDNDIAFDDQKTFKSYKNKNIRGKKHGSSLDGVAKEEEVQQIREQLEYIQQQQDELEKQEGLLFVELENQRKFFSQASQLVNDASQQRGVPDSFQPQLNQYFPENDYLPKTDSNKAVEIQGSPNDETAKYWTEQNPLLQIGGLDKNLGNNINNEELTAPFSDMNIEDMDGYDKSDNLAATEGESSKNNQEEENEKIENLQDDSQVETPNDLFGTNANDDNDRPLAAGYAMAEDVSYVDKKTVLPKIKHRKIKSRKQNKKSGSKH